MRLPDFTLARPRSLAEATELANDPRARIIAGGTDLVPNLRRGLEAPRTVVSLERLPELRKIEPYEGGLRIGACVPLARILEQAQLPAALREAAQSVGAPGHRNAGTIGGNLCLDTRCLYYNQSAEWRASHGYCLKRGGDICHVAPKGKVCRAAFSGDLAPALLALDARVEIAGPKNALGVKPLQDIYRDDGAHALTLAPGEIVAAILVPSANLRSGYAKARSRGAIDFPLAGVAMALALSRDKVKTLRVALTGTNSCPILLKGTEELVGRAADDALGSAISKLVQKQAKPLRTTIGAADYRRQVAAVLARRLLARLTHGDKQ
ncbi:MAG TPA: FAD binding domain-containing protein [Burkholderiales bacterium]